MFLNLDDRLTFQKIRKDQRRRLVATMHADGSGNLTLFYGTNLRGEVSLIADDWLVLYRELGRALAVVAEQSTGPVAIGPIRRGL